MFLLTRYGTSSSTTKSYGTRLRRTWGGQEVIWHSLLRLLTDTRIWIRTNSGSRMKSRRPICMGMFDWTISRRIRMYWPEFFSYTPNWIQVSGMCREWMRYWLWSIIASGTRMTASRNTSKVTYSSVSRASCLRSGTDFWGLWTVKTLALMAK